MLHRSKTIPTARRAYESDVWKGNIQEIRIFQGKRNYIKDFANITVDTKLSARFFTLFRAHYELTKLNDVSLETLTPGRPDIKR